MKKETPSNTTKAEREEIFVFRIGRKRWAGNTQLIEQVFKIHEYTPVPFTPPEVLGVIYLGGLVVPLIIPHSILGESASVTRWTGKDAILLNFKGERLSIAVDKLEDIYELSGDIEKIEHPFAAGRIKIANKRVNLLKFKVFYNEVKARIQLLESRI